MKLTKVSGRAMAAAIAAAWTVSAAGQTHQHEAPGPAGPMTTPAATPKAGPTATTMHNPADARQLVSFPDPMRLHTIANMRDHLLALQEIDVALSKDAFDKAASVAEQRLGMSSLELHGAAHMAAFMPPRMQEMGTQMHRAASRFAVEAQNASAGNDLRPALAALGAVMAQCVACHAAFRLQ